MQEIRWAVKKDQNGNIIDRKLQVLAGNQEWQDVEEIETEEKKPEEPKFG